jgi:hypothetical protein
MLGQTHADAGGEMRGVRGEKGEDAEVHRTLPRCGARVRCDLLFALFISYRIGERKDRVAGLSCP